MTLRTASDTEPETTDVESKVIKKDLKIDISNDTKQDCNLKDDWTSRAAVLFVQQNVSKQVLDKMMQIRYINIS